MKYIIRKMRLSGGPCNGHRVAPMHVMRLDEADIGNATMQDDWGLRYRLAKIEGDEAVWTFEKINVEPLK